MNKKVKIISSLALAGILTVNSIGIRAFATDKVEEIINKPAGVYRNLVKDKTVVTYALASLEDQVTVKDISAQFKNVTSFNGVAIPDDKTIVKTGDSFVSEGTEYTVLIYGDVNKDGKVNTGDALRIQQYVVGDAALDAIQVEAADVANDGKVNTGDALRIQRVAAELEKDVINQLPAVEDTIAPTITGITNGTTYNKEVTPKSEDKDIKTVVLHKNEVEVKGYTLGTAISEEGKYVLTVTDEAQNETKVSFEIDKTAPTIIVEGNKTEFLVKLGDTKFTLPNVMMEENEEVLQSSEKLDVTVAGTKEYTYIARDKAGNEAKQILTVTVDDSAPILSEIPEAIYVKLGDVVSYPEVTATDRVETGIEVVKTGDVDVTQEGTYEVTYTSTANSLGKIAEPVTMKVVIDGSVPVVQVTYNNAVLTNQNVIAYIEANEKVQIPEGWTVNTEKSVEGKTVLQKEYTENVVEENVVVKDWAGNTTTAVIAITNIDKEVQAEVSYDVEIPTRGNVKVTITASEAIKAIEGWTEETVGEVYSKEYTENTAKEGEAIVVTDRLGNTKTIVVNVQNIDREAPTAMISYSKTEPTQGNVIVTITANKELASIPATWTAVLNEEGEASKVAFQKEFTANTVAAGEELQITDLAGNTANINVKVANIDKAKPVPSVSYSTQAKTNEPVVVTIRADERLQELEGWKLAEDKKSMTKSFAQNVEEEVTVKDLAGNESDVVNIIIDQIDVKPAELIPNGIRYNTEEVAKSKMVFITFDEEMKTKEGWSLANGVTFSKVYSVANTYTEEFYDVAGNKTIITFTIEGVDSVAPEVSIINRNKDNTTGMTSGNVIVTISSVEKQLQELVDWTLSDDKKTLTREFSSFFDEIVTVKDIYGNTKEVRVTVDNIDKVAPVLSVTEADYDKVTNKDIQVVLEADKEVVAPKGWTAEYNKETKKTILKKTYTQNTPVEGEKVTVTDAIGNKSNEIVIIITKIDKVAPVLKNEAAEEIKNLSCYKEDIKVKVTDTDLASVALFVNEEETVVSTLLEDLKGQGYTTVTDSDKTATYKFVLTDTLGNVRTVAYTVDKQAPVVKNVEDTKVYTSVTPTSEEKDIETVTLSEAVVGEIEGYTLGTVVNTEGEYTLTVTDKAGNETVIQFSIDLTAPKIEGIAQDAVVNSNVTLTCADSDVKADTVVLTKNGTIQEGYALGTAIEAEGNYTLTLEDKVGNKNSIRFVIDKTAPTVSGIKDADEVKVAIPTSADKDIASVVLEEATEGEVENYELGMPVSKEGEYTLTVTDKAGNETIIHFVIDITKPEMEIQDKKVGEFYKEVTPIITEKNSKTIVLTNKGIVVANYNGGKITLSGDYVLTVTDKAGNSNVIKFKIDASAPEATVTYKKDPTNQPVLVTIDFAGKKVAITVDGGLALETSGQTEVIEGVTYAEAYYVSVTDNTKHEITVTDALGNTATFNIEVTNYDKIAPTATLSKVTEGEKVTVTVVANENIQLPTGWKYIDDKDKTTICKEYAKTDTTCKATILDMAGNELAIDEEISNITE